MGFCSKHQTMSGRKLDIMTDRPCACEGPTLDRLIQPTVMAMLAAGPLHRYALVEQLEISPLMKGSRPNDTRMCHAAAATPITLVPSVVAR